MFMPSRRAAVNLQKILHRVGTRTYVGGHSRRPPAWVQSRGRWLRSSHCAPPASGSVRVCVCRALASGDKRVHSQSAHARRQGGSRPLLRCQPRAVKELVLTRARLLVVCCSRCPTWPSFPGWDLRGRARERAPASPRQRTRTRTRSWRPLVSSLARECTSRRRRRARTRTCQPIAIHDEFVLVRAGVEPHHDRKFRRALGIELALPLKRHHRRPAIERAGDLNVMGATAPFHCAGPRAKQRGCAPGTQRAQAVRGRRRVRCVLPRCSIRRGDLARPRRGPPLAAAPPVAPPRSPRTGVRLSRWASAASIWAFRASS